MWTQWSSALEPLIITLKLIPLQMTVSIGTGGNRSWDDYSSMIQNIKNRSTIPISYSNSQTTKCECESTSLRTNGWFSVATRGSKERDLCISSRSATGNSFFPLARSSLGVTAKQIAIQIFNAINLHESQISQANPSQ